MQYDKIDNVSLGAERLPKLKEFTEGTYLLKVLTFRKHSTQQHGDGVLAEFEILNSSAPDLHPVGSKASYMLLEKYNKFDLYWKNLANLCRGLLGKKPKGEELALLLSDEDPASGTKVQVRVSKPEGKTYNTFDWSSVSEG